MGKNKMRGMKKNYRAKNPCMGILGDVRNARWGHEVAIVGKRAVALPTLDSRQVVPGKRAVDPQRQSGRAGDPPPLTSELSSRR